MFYLETDKKYDLDGVGIGLISSFDPILTYIGVFAVNRS